MDRSSEPQISTCTRWFKPLNLQPEDVTAEDLATALANTCRFNGHVNRYYSVAQHSISVARLVEERDHSYKTVLQALLHDAAEPYLLGDLPGPTKNHIFIQPRQGQADNPKWFETTSRMVIHRALDCLLFDLECEKAVEKADKDMLFVEFEALKPAHLCETFPVPFEIKEDARKIGLRDLGQCDTHVLAQDFLSELANLKKICSA